MSSLVTGGAGFIGSSLVERLAESGEQVRVIDDLSSGSSANLRDVAGSIDFVVGDIADVGALREAIEGVDVVYHLAALPSVPRSVANPLATHRVNLEGTLNVLLESRNAGVRRVVNASSSSVYGDAEVLPKHEELAPRPSSPYAASKLAAEALCGAFTASYGLDTVSLRFFNVFGPKQDPNSEYAAVVPRFMTKMLAGERPEVFGDGGQSRDFTHVSNAVTACILGSEAGGEAAGQAMNIGCGTRISLLELIEILNGLMGTSIAPTFSEARKGDVRHSEASIAQARRLIGYEPTVSVKQGLTETLDWFAADQP